jgi:hypothetical protein
MVIMTPTDNLKIRSANLQDGIEYEVKRELVNMKISKKVSEMCKNGSYRNPSESDLAELRQLAASR